MEKEQTTIGAFVDSTKSIIQSGKNYPHTTDEKTLILGLEIFSQAQQNIHA